MSSRISELGQALFEEAPFRLRVDELERAGVRLARLCRAIKPAQP